MDLEYCIVCLREVTARQHGFQCDQCHKWQHRICGTGITQYSYRRMVRREMEIDWSCNNCKTEMETDDSFNNEPPTMDMSSTETSTINGSSVTLPDVPMNTVDKNNPDLNNKGEKMRVSSSVTSQVPVAEETVPSVGDHEESMIVTSVAVFSKETVAAASLSCDVSRPFPSIQDATPAVLEQIPALCSPFKSVDDVPARESCEGPQREEDSPEELLDQTVNNADPLSSLLLGDELDLNQPYQNKEKKTASESSGNKRFKRKLSADDDKTNEERSTRKRARSKIQLSDDDKEMEAISLQILPKSPHLRAYGFQFRLKLELVKRNDFSRLREAIRNGVPMDAQVEELFVSPDMPLTNEDDSCTDNNIVEQLSLSSENNEVSVKIPAMTYPDMQPLDYSNKDTNTQENVSEKTNKNAYAGNELNPDWYSDISEDEDKATDHISNPRQIARYEGCHVDTPPPYSDHLEPNCSMQTIRKTPMSPHIGKTKIKQTEKRKPTADVKQQEIEELPPETDDITGIETTGRSPPTQTDEPRTSVITENKTKSLSSHEATRKLPVFDTHFQTEKSGKEAPSTNGYGHVNKSEEESKLPYFDIIFASNDSQITSEEICKPSTNETASGKDVKKKLKEKLLEKGIFSNNSTTDIIDEQLIAVRAVDIKIEVPDSYVDEVEDPEATLMFGFDGPGGFVVPGNI